MLLVVCTIELAAQQSPVPAEPGPGGRRGALAPPQMNGPLSNEEVYTLLDSFVMAGAQSALQLTDAQFSAFFQRMMRLQRLQRQHRAQRQRALVELRQLMSPKNEPPEDTVVAAKTKELDDLESQIAVDERKALADIDQVLQVPQRARLRLFLENMERRKLELLVRARQNRGGGPPPVPRPEPSPMR